ncbi:MAG: MlaD family protein [Solirubrobacterales bacterium]
MNRRFHTPIDVISPVMVGAITVLVAAMAVFLSYNAGSSLPFVPFYEVRVQVPDAQELVANNEVLIGGRRVGSIGAVESKLDEDGDPYAEMALRLEITLDGQIRDDATARVRSRSLLGAKYLELTLGGDGDPLAQGDTLPLSRARENVEVDEVLDEFDEPTRKNFARVIDGLGTGFAARGGDFNDSLAAFADLATDARPVLAAIAAPGTRFERQIAALVATAAELGSDPSAVAAILDRGATTFEALEAAGPALEETIEQTPETLAVGTEALAELRPVLARARVIAGRLVPSAKLLPATAKRLTAAARAGTPALRRSFVLGPLLEDTFAELEGLAAVEPSVRVFDDLADLLPEVQPVAEFLAPYQTVCNYVAIAARNVASTVSEGNQSGNWLRFNAILGVEEMLPADLPAPDLHFNPYPNGAAPGQPFECEGGNEPYLHGRRLGNVPGDQGTATEATSPEETARLSETGEPVE